MQRASKWYGLHFGGTSDWAVDLEWSFGSKCQNDPDISDLPDLDGPVCDDTREFDSLEDLEKATHLVLIHATLTV